MTKILVTGADGQLGSEIVKLSRRFSNMKFTFLTIDDLDLTDNIRVSEYFAKHTFDYLINCAAYTAVDKAESDVDSAYKVNSTMVGFLGEMAKKTGARVIHISTDYVFDGKAYSPYNEDTPTNPVSVYGKSKLEGEELLMRSNPESIIIRTAWLYSSFGNNFVKTMVRLGKERDELRVVQDQIGSPTNAADLAEAIVTIIYRVEEEGYKFVPGVFHYTNEGVASWYDFAYHIFEMAEIACSVVPVPSEEYPTPAPRPFYSVLNKQKIRNVYKVDTPHWYESLQKLF